MLHRAHPSTCKRKCYVEDGDDLQNISTKAWVARVVRHSSNSFVIQAIRVVGYPICTSEQQKCAGLDMYGFQLVRQRHGASHYLPWP
jgi:hypothetical protein